MEKQKRKLIKDKYVAMFMHISNTTIISYKNSNKYLYRYEAYRKYFINMLDKLNKDDIVLYSNNLKLFEDDIKSFNILNKFAIL